PVVSYVIRTFPKLSESFVLREVLALHEAGVPIEVWSLVPPSDAEAALVPGAAPLAGLIRTPPRGRSGLVRMMGDLLALLLRRPRSTLRMVWWALVWTVRERDPRTLAALPYAAHLARRAAAPHLHAHFANTPATTAVLAAGLSGRTASYTAHARDLWVVTSPQFLRAKTRRCTFAAGETTFAADLIRQRAGWAVPAHTVTNIVPAPEPTALTQPREPGLIVVTARLVEKKGLDLLLRAMAELLAPQPGASGGSPVRLEVIGDGPDRAALQALAVELGIADHVLFRGAVAYDDVRATLARASIFALPAREATDGDTDGLPVAILEAMAHRLAVVSTPIAGIPEAIVDGQTGRLVPAEDVPALTAALRELLADAALRDRLGQAAGDYVAARHSGPANARQLAELFGAP
ncbi:MAG: glycosyltransferase family 4 protein, partial [Solirubrobacteraceae bacterium]|nr:glycosyltransferase family 4 protein [Solirubrobacteraceae bacterium]